MLDKTIEEFVRNLTGDTKHSGRAFFEHLKGTYDLLEQSGAPPHVCLAGLCHSIYGTNIFQQASVPMEERDCVAELIGDEAEWLAYIFCSCNRPLTLINAVDRGPPYVVLNRHNGDWMILTPAQLRELLQIEKANLEEQGCMDSRVVDALCKVGHFTV